MDVNLKVIIELGAETVSFLSKLAGGSVEPASPKQPKKVKPPKEAEETEETEDIQETASDVKQKHTKAEVIELGTSLAKRDKPTLEKVKKILAELELERISKVTDDKVDQLYSRLSEL